MTEQRTISLLAFAILAGHSLAAPVTAAPPARAALKSAASQAAFDLGVVDKAIATAVRGNPRLHGAWMFVEINEPAGAVPARLTLQRVLDRGRADMQRRELDGLMSRLLPAHFALVRRPDREVPVSELLAHLQDEIEFNPRLIGCQIGDAYLAPNPSEEDKLDLVLLGRVLDEEQVVEVEKTCGALMRRDAAWLASGYRGRAGAGAGQSALAIYPNTTKLAVVVPSESQGKALFSAGLRYFWNGQYDHAQRAFRQAAIEAPRNPQYYYWHILAQLALGQTDRAFGRMQSVVGAFGAEPLSHTLAVVSKSLERVQGPLRQQLQDLEAQAILQVSRKQRGRS